MGDKLGLYRALAGAGPLTSSELAERTGTAERYVREWLNAQAAGDFVAYDPDSCRYTLPPERLCRGMVTLRRQPWRRRQRLCRGSVTR